MKPETIYITPESWGSETYYFLESAEQEFIKGMESCLDGEIEPPEELTLNENGLYESIYYKNMGRQYFELIDDSDPSNVQMKYLKSER